MVLEGFIGEIEQRPPNISAVKVDGKRAYKLARSGEEFKLNTRVVSIYDFAFKLVEPSKLQFEIECSSGTYIRSIARDLGQKLGVGACLEELRRVCSAPFSVENAKAPEELSEKNLLNWESLFPNTEKN